jgi:superoxide dismutase, Fe-Mn family
MSYEVTPLPFKPHRLEGLSDRLLVSHYENNYGGAVHRLNAIEERLQVLDCAAASTFDLNGLGRERLAAANSMILHEAYFDSLGGNGEPRGDVATALERDFGSVDRWHAEFSAMGKALGGGSGWVLLTWSERLGRLTNQWAADHTNTLAAGQPILALDMYEHAYAIDFGAKAGAYVDAFLRNISWERVETRLGQTRQTYANPVSAGAAVPQITAAELRAELKRGADITLVDVCLPIDLARRSDMLPGARFLAPEAIDDWAGTLPRDKAVVVYCIYGFQVSGEATTELRRRGLQARALAGGITAWHAMAGPTVPLPQSQSHGGST